MRADHAAALEALAERQAQAAAAPTTDLSDAEVAQRASAALARAADRKAAELRAWSEAERARRARSPRPAEAAASRRERKAEHRRRLKEAREAFAATQPTPEQAAANIRAAWGAVHAKRAASEDYAARPFDRLRLEAGLSVRALARQARTSPSSVVLAQRGLPLGDGPAERIAAVLGLTLGELRELTGSPPNSRTT